MTETRKQELLERMMGQIAEEAPPVEGEATEVPEDELEIPEEDTDADLELEEAPEEDQPEHEGIEESQEEEAEEAEEEAPAVDAETELRDKEIARLSKIVEQQEAELLAGKKRVEPQFEDQVYVEDEEALGNVVSDPEKFNVLVNSAVKKAIASSRELLLAEIPEVVTPLMQGHINQRLEVERFWHGHPELVPIRGLIEPMAKELATEHADDENYGLAELLAELPAFVKKRLGKRAPAAKVPLTGAKTKARRPQRKKLDPVQSEMAGLIQGRR